jgi:hypothetical protein
LPKIIHEQVILIGSDFIRKSDLREPVEYRGIHKNGKTTISEKLRMTLLKL